MSFFEKRRKKKAKHKADKTRERAMPFFDDGMKDLYGNGNFFRSVDNFNRAVEIDESFFDAWLRLGLAHHKMENYDDAIRCFDKCISMNEEYQAHYNKGLALFKKDEKKKALASFKRSEKLMPGKHKKGGSIFGWIERCE